MAAHAVERSLGAILVSYYGYRLQAAVTDNDAWLCFCVRRSCGD